MNHGNGIISESFKATSKHLEQSV